MTFRPTVAQLALSALVCGLTFGTACSADTPAGKAPASFHGLTVKTIDGKDKRLSDYKGKVVLVVNTASQCGYTPQYKGLQALYSKMNTRGFEVLAFPSNDFGGQEPGTESEIKQFCESRFQTTFPLFSKVHAKGPKKSPVYRFLTEASDKKFQGDVRWNFTKFLVDGSGKVVGRYESHVSPSDKQLRADIERALANK